MDQPGMSPKDLYLLFASAMSYPEDPDRLGQHASFFAGLAREAMEGQAGSCASQEDLEGLQAVATRPEAHLEDLQIEFTRLFINSPGRSIAPPYGSVYLSPERSLWGPWAARVKEFYREHGMEPADSNAVPDELTLELQFLAHLSGNGNHEAEELFLRDLFRPWFKEFSQIVKREATHPFYRVVVCLIEQFTSEEDLEHGTEDE